MRTPNGYIQESPAVGMARAAMKQLGVFAAEFGLTPASRSRVKVDDEKRGDEFDQYLNRGPQDPK